MIIHKASEDYLEALLMMQERHGYITMGAKGPLLKREAEYNGELEVF